MAFAFFLQPRLHLPPLTFPCWSTPSREAEKLCPHAFGHQPATQPGPPLPGPVTTPPPPLRRQSGPPLLRGGGARADQPRRQPEVGVGTPPVPRRPPQQRLQRRGGAGPLRLRVAGRLRQAAGRGGRLPGHLPEPRTVQLQSAAQPKAAAHALSAAGGAAGGAAHHFDPL